MGSDEFLAPNSYNKDYLQNERISGCLHDRLRQRSQIVSLQNHDPRSKNATRPRPLRINQRPHRQRCQHRKV